MAGAIEVRGYREVITSLGKVNSRSKAVLAGALREAAWPVQSDARSRLNKYADMVPVGIAVRARGVAVTQRAKKVNGLRPDFGALQMTRGLIPALEANREETYKGVELALDTLITESGF